MKWKTAVLFSGIALLSIVLYNILYVVISAVGHNMEYENTLAALKSKLDTVESTAVNDEIVSDLEKLNGWIQFVDSNGTEVWSIFKPSEVPSRYNNATKDKVIYKLSNALYYNVIRGKTHLLLKKDVSKEETYYTYYLGIPFGDGIKKLNLERVFSFFYQINIYGIVTFVVILLVAGLFGYLYARRVLPCRNIVKRADGIGTKEYKPFEEKGIYKDVYKQINAAAARVYSQKLESDRSVILIKKGTNDVIHELKDSIATIKGYAEILSEVRDRSGESQEKEFAEIILSKAQSLDGLLEEISEIHKDPE